MIREVANMNVNGFMVSCEKCHRVENPVGTVTAARRWLMYHECRP